MPKVYDQASFHMQRGKNIETSLLTIKTAIQWAGSKRLLSKQGAERLGKIIQDPKLDGPNTKITSEDLTPVGQKVFDSAYNQWLVQVMQSNYRDFSTDPLDKAYDKLESWGSTKKDNEPITQKDPQTHNEDQTTNKQKFVGKEGITQQIKKLKEGNMRNGWVWEFDIITPVTDDDFIQYEQLCGCKLPDDFKNYVKQNNGKVPQKAKVTNTMMKDTGWEATIYMMFSFSPKDKSNAFDQFKDFHDTEKGWGVTEKLCPFATDGGGNVFCLDYQRGNPVISFWNHEESKTTPISDTFSNFIASLEYNPNENIREGVMTVNKIKIPVREVAEKEPPIIVDPNDPNGEPIEGDPIKDIIHSKKPPTSGDVKEDCAVIHICIKVKSDDDSKLNGPIAPPAENLITDEGEPAVQKVISVTK